MISVTSLHDRRAWAMMPGMSKRFEELDYQQTPLGELILRRRASITLPGTDVFEVKINGEFLMSSLVNDSEISLADLGLAPLKGRPCDVLIGGLGLGCTAGAALAHENVQSLRVVEFLQPVISWHERRLVPASGTLMDDPRCELVHGDFFEHVGHAPMAEQKPYDAVLLDIDHSPESLLDSRHGRFYLSDGLENLALHVAPDGVFALWSATPPADEFIARLGEVFAKVEAHVVEFHNPFLHEQDENVIVVATRRP